MVTTIGVRELKNNASRILRAVREEMVEYVVTVRGEPIAVLRPLNADEEDRLKEVRRAAALAEMRELAHRVAASWAHSRSAIELIEEQRRG